MYCPARVLLISCNSEENKAKVKEPANPLSEVL
jgi:hypothetical protein